MDSFTFVHCADLHLDSPFEGMRALDERIGDVLKESTFRAFDNIVDLAVHVRAQFIIVAGDVYDSRDRSLRAQMRFRDGLVRAAEHGIWCFVAHGNHDPLSGWEAGLRLPDSVVRFGAAVETHPFPPGGDAVAMVSGVSHPTGAVTANLALQFPAGTGGPFSIGVLHCNVGGIPDYDNYAPCEMDDLVSRRLDYWALGHVHSRRILRPGDPWVVYPGNPQARSVREPGERGCYVVRVAASGQVNCEFVPTDVVRWYAKRVDVSGLASADDLLDSLQALSERVRREAEGRCAVVRAVLVGRGPLHHLLRRPGLVDELVQHLREEEGDRENPVWIESVQDETRAAVDLEQRSAIADFVGEFLRCVRQCRGGEEGRSILREALRARPEHAVIGSYLDQLSDEDLLSILDEAEGLGFDLLAGEEDWAGAAPDPAGA